MNWISQSTLKSMKKNGFILSLLSSLFIISACDFSKSRNDVYKDIHERSMDSVEAMEYSARHLLQHDRLVLVDEKDYSSFYVHERKSLITKYECTNCHSATLDELKATSTSFPHADIKLFHADFNTMNCLTCHNQENFDYLRSTTDKKIDFDSSYKLCSQCHSSQFKDWKGGAHGKRIGGWVPPRVSKTCVECHNPHSPSFESKIPAYPAFIKKNRE